jgi:hypothetical protein
VLYRGELRAASQISSAAKTQAGANSGSLPLMFLPFSSSPAISP